uniref:Uncharacterized protein n=1 Tax=Schizaphis graminum TaxID=13262 RepID=A0A2S2P4E8_SCHGA
MLSIRSSWTNTIINVYIDGPSAGRDCMLIIVIIMFCTLFCVWVLENKTKRFLFNLKTIECTNHRVHVYRIRVRGRCLRSEQTSRESQQRRDHRGHRRLFGHHRSGARSRSPVGCCARRFASADLPGRTGSGEMSLGRRIHHERSAAHGKRVPVVAVQCVVFPSLLKR